MGQYSYGGRQNTSVKSWAISVSRRKPVPFVFYKYGPLIRQRNRNRARGVQNDVLSGLVIFVYNNISKLLQRALSHLDEAIK